MDDNYIDELSKGRIFAQLFDEWIDSIPRGPILLRPSEVEVPASLLVAFEQYRLRIESNIGEVA